MNIPRPNRAQRRSRPTGRLRSAILVVSFMGLAAGLSACTEERRDAIRGGVGTVTITQPAGNDGTAGSPEPSTTVAEEPSPTTEAPTPETIAPETTAPATGADQDDAGGSSTLMLLALIATATLIIFLLGRRSSRSRALVPAPSTADGTLTWHDRVRSVYTGARWLLDNTDRPYIETRTTAATGDAQAMSAVHEVRRRLDWLLNELYEAEADAPTASTRQTLRELGAAARALDNAAESVALAPSVGAGLPSPEWGVWAEARRRLETVLDRLADELRTT